MKRNRFLFMLLLGILLSLACSLGGLTRSEPTSTPVSEGRCGDGVCDGPENSQNCSQDCVDTAPVDEINITQDNPSEETLLTSGDDITYGYIYSTITLDRTPGNGDCGIEPWYSPGCNTLKIWWDMHIKAFASTPVLIIPDGQNRWAITNHPDTAAKVGVTLAEGTGVYQSITLNPAITNPECSGEIEGKPFNFQVMGVYENGVTELILSANPVEHAWGSCMQAGYDWETNDLLYGWAATLSGNPEDLSLQMGETFKDLPGQYTFTHTVNTNPSPENRDLVSVELGFLCTGTVSSSTTEPVACPWEN